MSMRTNRETHGKFRVLGAPKVSRKTQRRDEQVINTLNRLGFGWNVEVVPFSEIPEYGSEIVGADTKKEDMRVARLRGALENGEVLPMIVVARNYTVLDGAHRIVAMKQLGMDSAQAIVVDEDYPFPVFDERHNKLAEVLFK
jgi:hypothetical protein